MNTSDTGPAISAETADLANRLAEISLKGPVPAIGSGNPAVGLTLLSLLGVSFSTTETPRYLGIALTARRGTQARDVNRVSLFAKVANWDVSECKSSREIVERYGYRRDDRLQLYCTVRCKDANAQRLRLEVDRPRRYLNEVFVDEKQRAIPVVRWRLDELEHKLMSTHAASAWIVAVPSIREGREFFHFRYATFLSSPRVSEFSNLLEQGTITVDHLIRLANGAATERGPLFKIKPSNAEALFPISLKLDLMDFNPSILRHQG
jgi:hypothetical protein